MPESGIFAYVSNSESWDIIVLELDAERGGLSRVQQLPVIDKAMPKAVSMPMAVSPDRRFLYAALRAEPYSVASFAIDSSSGQLTPLGYAPLADSMAYISTDRTGRFLFGASINKAKLRSSLISVNPIGPHGFVQPPHQIVNTEPKMHAILPDPSNRYVFATSNGGDLILRQKFDANTGMFAPDALPPVRVKPNAGPRHFVFHPNNRFLYLLNWSDATIYTFDYDASAGSLRELQIVSVLPPGFPESERTHAADLHLTPDGRFLYASERASQTLAAFQVDLASGMLTRFGNFLTEGWIRGFNIDPYGRHLLAVGQRSHSMTSYAIDRESGHLAKLNDYPMGKGPNWVEIVRLP